MLFLSPFHVRLADAQVCRYAVKHLWCLSDEKVGPTARRANIRMPFATSMKASFCGVVTMTAAEKATDWHRVSWMSPVPGGKSTTR